MFKDNHRLRGLYFSVAFGLALLFVFQIPCISGNRADRLDKVAAWFYECNDINGVILIAEKGKVIYQRAFGLADFDVPRPNEPASKFYLYSLSRPFTAVLVMKLVEEGKLRLEGTISEYLPYYRPDTGGKITLHHLLTHSHGLPEPDLTRLNRDLDGSTRDIITRYFSGDPTFEAGSKFEYSDFCGYTILAAIIEKVTGKPFSEVLLKKVMGPSGMTSSGYADFSTPVAGLSTPYVYKGPFDPEKRADFFLFNPNGSTGVYSTADDLLSWSRSLFSGKLLTPRSLETLLDNHCLIEGSNYYGYGWHKSKQPLGSGIKTVASHGGGGSVLFTRILEDDRLIILLNNASSRFLLAVNANLLRVLYGMEPMLPKKPIALVLHRSIRQDGIEAALKKYRRIREKHSDDYTYGENGYNLLGYKLLGENRFSEAIEIFKLGVEAYPGSWNGYDSLGEAYLKAGNRQSALQNYRKAAELNPRDSDFAKQNHINQRELIKRLETKHQEPKTK